MKVGGNGGFDHIRADENLNRQRRIRLKEACQNKPNTRVARNCGYCKNEFEIRAKSKKEYCCVTCANKGSAAKNPKGRFINCAFCEKKIYKSYYAIKTYPRFFCNKVCSGKYLKSDKKKLHNELK